MPAVDKAMAETEAQALNTLMPGNLNVRLGDRLKAQDNFHIQEVIVAADASGGQNFVAEVSGDLVDAFVHCTATNAAGTIGCRRSTTNMTTLMVCATVGNVVRTTNVVQGQKAIVAGETLNAKANGASDRGILYLIIKKTVPATP